MIRVGLVMMCSGGMGDWEIGLESANGEIPRQHREVMENGGALCTIFLYF